MKSEPSAQYVNNDYGLVVFDQAVAADANEFSVGLHKYLEVSVVSDTNRALKINGGEEQQVKANQRILTPKMKYGDRITIETTEEWPKLENNKDLVLASQEKNDDVEYGFKYVMVLPEPNSSFAFNPSEYTDRDHGTLLFKYLGEEVTDTIYPAVGRRIYYEEKRADVGYWLPEEDHYIEVKDQAETERQLNSIQFTPRVPVLVKLPQPDHGGTITYKVNGETIDEQALKDGAYSTYSGAVIEMEFNFWQGWMAASGVKLQNGAGYKVSEDGKQTISVDGTDVKDIIQEDPNHKPLLKVTLDKSVGDNMKFNFTASGLEYKEQSYSGAWYQNKRDIIKNEHIGTEDGIEITMSNRAISKGEAVKLVITKKGTDHSNHKKINPIVETRLVENLAEIEAPIDIYKKEEIAGSTIWYDSIEIEISVVNVEQYREFTALLNSTVSVLDLSRDEVMQKGDQIESKQKVRLTISPNEGYYITGKGVKGNTFQTEMSYSDYVKEGKSTIEDHPPHKYCRITLDASDPFASYFYTLDGVEKKGIINAKSGQELKLTYEIQKESDHKLKESTGSFLPWNKNETIATKTLKITDDMDGKTIGRQDFGIEVN